MFKYIIVLLCFFNFSTAIAQSTTPATSISEAHTKILRPILKDYLFKVKALGLEINRLNQRTEKVLSSLSDNTVDLQISDKDAIKTTDNYSFTDVLNNTTYLDSSSHLSSKDLKVEAEIILLTNDVNLLSDYSTQLSDTYRKLINTMDNMSEDTITSLLNEFGYSVLPIVSEKVIALNIENLNKTIQNLNWAFGLSKDSVPNTQ